MTVRQKLERRLETMPGLDCRASRYGEGRSYFVGDREIAHFHGETRLDVRLTKEEIRRHKVDGTLDPRIRTRGPSAEWAEVLLSEPSDVALAERLVGEALRANS